jgi:uncharacterized membrane protein YjjB (DUF3815 family)
MGKRNGTRLATAITTERIGTTAQSIARYLPTTPTSGRSPGIYEQVKGSFCQL